MEKLFGIAVLTAAAVIFYAASAKNYVRDRRKDAYCLLITAGFWSGFALYFGGYMTSAIIFTLVWFFFLYKRNKHLKHERYFKSKREARVVLLYQHWFWPLFIFSFIGAVFIFCLIKAYV